MMKNFFLYSLMFLGFAFYGTSQKDCFPTKRDRVFVYDKANIIDAFDEEVLNDKLRKFTKETSNVLVVVTTNDLCGYEPVVYSYTFGENQGKGIGRKDLENGVVLLVKPKTSSSKGQVFVAVGTGLQGAIPDIIAKRDLVERELIPNFKRNDYYGGINKASNVIIDLATGEINEQEYLAGNGSNDIIPILVILLIFLIFIYLMSKYGRNGGDWGDWEDYDRHGKHRGRRSSPWVIIGGGGGSSGGFSGGGFGGFGGGGFSGGGAGGSW